MINNVKFQRQKNGFGLVTAKKSIASDKSSGNVVVIIKSN